VYSLVAVGTLSDQVLETAYGSGPITVNHPILDTTESVVSALIAIDLF
jgi:hypothetical protein